MISPEWNKFRPYLLQLCLWGVIASIGWFGVRFLLQGIRMTQNQLQEFSVLAEHRQKQMNEIPRLGEQFDFIQEHQDALRIILAKEDLVNFIELLEKLAQENNVIISMTSKDNTLLESKTTVLPSKSDTKGVKVDSESAANEKKPSVKKETGIRQDLPLKKSLTLTITVTGSYSDIVVYLQKIETMPFALDVVGIHIEERSEEKDILFKESGVNPFTPDGLADASTDITERSLDSKQLFLNAHFETVVYMRE